MTTDTFDYSKLDHPHILQKLFHPRVDMGSGISPDIVAHEFEVEDGVRLAARFHLAAPEEPHILFFHGNGEIVSDYDTIGPMYVAEGLSLLAVGYRGYGGSGGTPTVTTMLRDSLVILEAVKTWLASHDRTGPLLVMGRSLGSVSALEIAATTGSDIAGLVLDSAIALTVPLLLNLGLEPQAYGITEADGFGNIRKIERVTKPTLILHAQHDQLIPVRSAEILQVQCSANNKEFQMVPGADHNTIIAITGQRYFQAIKRFANKIQGKRTKRYSRETKDRQA